MLLEESGISSSLPILPVEAELCLHTNRRRRLQIQSMLSESDDAVVAVVVVSEAR